MMIDLLLYGLLSWLYLIVWFFAVARYMGMRKRDNTWTSVPRFIRYSLVVGLVPGLVIDGLFNLLYGSIAFRELPKESTFSDRVTRIVRFGGPRPELAMWWAEVMNNIDPGHIRYGR